MRKLLRRMAAELESGEPLVLVTITAASGSVPRGTGARMLIGRGGRICGTIGGGAVEYRSEKIAAQVLGEGHSAGRHFALNKSDVQDLGMICGGDVDVWFHYLAPGDVRFAAALDEALGRFERMEDLWMLCGLADGGHIGFYSKKDGLLGLDGPAAAAQHAGKHPQRFEAEGCSWYMEQISFAGQVFIFGGGHVAQELQPLLTHLGFPCTVLDDRAEFADQQLFPTAQKVQLVDFKQLGGLGVTADDYACVMTRGHAGDLDCEAAMLRTPACYIGVIGSRRKTAAVNEKLRGMGFTDGDIARVTTPIGLDIGAETPAEIAVSIAGQLIDVRAQRIAGAV